jgi:nicotinate-nucleotide adenylyltransferase
MARIGLLGGTFNPPHLAHLVCAQEARARLELDRVLLLPTRIPPHKTIDRDPGAEIRLALCEAAVAGDPRLGASSAEVDVPGSSFTVDTLRRLHDQRPEDDLTFIVGGDMACSLASWHEPETLLELAELGVAGREGSRPEDVVAQLAGLRGVPERLRFFAMPRLDISSSAIRERVAAGLPIRYLVPDAVAERIAAEGLYREAVRA